MTQSRRDRTQIVCEILQSTMQKPVTKTRIQYSNNLSFQQLNDYLTLVLRLKLLEPVKDECLTKYRLTQRGHKYTRYFGSIRGMFELPEPLELEA